MRERERKNLPKQKMFVDMLNKPLLNSPTTSHKKKKQKQKTKKKKNKKQKQIYLQDPQTNNIKTNLTIIGSEKPKKIEE